jgi:hypothetical protein
MRIVSLLTDGGRLTMRDQLLTEFGGDGTQEQTIGGGNEYMQVLKDRFGIHLDAEYHDLLSADRNADVQSTNHN